ncbi:universal stress protein YxiE-like isoform X1 [Mya arenaria]|uniref:universal stress protein YxiE-like isoform X1 n=1 Tax=Mya arenaria TaxID=6604 RepID=UPI0022E5EB10|nr:universal stress protein YxiE-like isoform X1 [Mya arenaria]
MAHAPQEGQRKVLIGIDGSEAAENAFNWYLNNLKQPNDYVYGITVPEYNFAGVTVISMVGPLADPQALQDDFITQHKVVEKLCSDFTAKLRQAGVKGQADEQSGDKPGPTLVEMAEKLGVDCVIMGTRGLSKLKKLLMGSVSSYVVQHCNVPVSVIPLKKKD